MNTFVVARVLDPRGLSVAQTESFGDVDIRPPAADTDAERGALHLSCSSFGEVPDDSMAMRIVTVVKAHDIRAADQAAGERFEEVANVRSSQALGTSTIRVLETGFFRTIGGPIDPRLSTATPAGLHFRTPTTFFQPVDLGRWLCANKRSDLAQRLIRSYHWSHRAELELNRQLRVLFRWFAMESIWSLGREDNIVPRILWALGVPNGSGLAVLTPARYSRLTAHKSFTYWKRHLEAVVRDIKEFRNESVHSGFRAQDKPVDKLRHWDRLVLMACGNVQRHAEKGLLSGLTSTEDLLEYLPVLLDTDDYVNDVIGRIIFWLENPELGGLS